MRSRTHIIIGLIPAIGIITLDILHFCFAEQYGGEVLALAFTTLGCITFGVALVGNKSNIAWWIYRTWWTLQLLPLMIALIHSIYAISQKCATDFVSILLFCALFIGLPTLFFRIGLRGLDHNKGSEDNEEDEIWAAPDLRR